VLIAPAWVTEVSWATQEVQVTLTRAQIEASPEYNPDVVLDRAYEEQLHGHYDRPVYW
jgi:stress response protein YsnF